MITRIEIDGFKTFRDFGLNLGPFVAIVGANASGKSNLFDAIKFVAGVAQTDIRSAMQDIRGTPVELFRSVGPSERQTSMTFAIEMLLPPKGVDSFGTAFELRTQRLRYEIEVAVRVDEDDRFQDVYVRHERCTALAKSEERQTDLGNGSPIKYDGRLKPFIVTDRDAAGEPRGFEIRQDGPNKRGHPVVLPAVGAPRTALSTISTAEFPHLYAVREMLASIQFLHADPQASRRPTDRLAPRRMLPDASNLATVLAKLREETANRRCPNGVLTDIGIDLSSLIPSVASIQVDDSLSPTEHSFSIKLADANSFNSRVMSDGTLRLLALLTVLNDPKHGGVLCFEEPENGVHEARIEALIEILRSTAGYQGDESPSCFQILVNTHSPAVLAALEDREVVLCDVVGRSRAGSHRTMRTRMRTVGSSDAETGLTQAEVAAVLRRPTGVLGIQRRPRPPDGCPRGREASGSEEHPAGGDGRGSAARSPKAQCGGDLAQHRATSVD